MKRDDEVMRPHLAAAESGEGPAARSFLYADLEQLSAHAAFSVQRSLEHGQGSIAVLARLYH